MKSSRFHGRDAIAVAYLMQGLGGQKPCQGAHPTPLAKNLGKKGLNINFPVFILRPLI